MLRFVKNLFRGDQAWAARGRKRKAVPLAIESLEARYALSTLNPIQVRQYYGFDRVGFLDATHPLQLGDGRNTTIAIVDAYDDPNIANDLATFDIRYGIAAPPNLTIVNQSGGTTLPQSDPGHGRPGDNDYRAPRSWETETALDVEYAHAMAPGASILLVEANDNSETNLDAAVQYAASQPGVVVVSMSYGRNDYSGETSRDSTFNHTGVTYVASTGDSGAPGAYPAFSPNVVAVGGTTLDYSLATGYSERGWSGSGGGISQFESQPAYQVGVVPDSMSTDAQGIKRRTIPDAAFIADSVTIYDTFFGSGYYSVVGTSISAPIMAGMVSIVDQGRAYLNNQASYNSVDFLTDLYRLPGNAFVDITTGTSTGNPNYSAGPGYDLVTGRGTPIVPLFVAGMTGNPLQVPLVSDANGNVFRLDPVSGIVYELGAGSTWNQVGSGISSLVSDATGNVFALNPVAGIIYEHVLGAGWTWNQVGSGISNLVRDETGNVFSLNPVAGIVYEHVLGAGWTWNQVDTGISSLVSDATGNVFALNPVTGLIYEHVLGAGWAWDVVGSGISSLVSDATGNVFSLNPFSGIVYEHVLGAGWTWDVVGSGISSMVGDALGNVYNLNPVSGLVYEHVLGAGWTWNIVGSGISSLVSDATGNVFSLNPVAGIVYEHVLGAGWTWNVVGSGISSLVSDATGSVFALNPSTGAVYELDDHILGSSPSWYQVDSGISSLVSDTAGNVFVVDAATGARYEHVLGTGWDWIPV
jgi:hypothetical protein